MSGRESSFNFKREVPQSAGSGAASALSNGHQGLNHKKKWTKPSQGTNYMMGGGQRSVPTTKGVNVAGKNLDISTSENVAGGMSVSDIKLTMSEEEESSLPQPKSPRSNEQFYETGSSQINAGSGAVGEPSKNTERIPPKKCFEPLCDACAWHHSVLDSPNRVQWMAKTVRVELVRQRGRPWPGFIHKLKKHRQKDDIYIQVTSIARDGIASESGLCVGDLILSVNTIPLQINTMSALDFEKLDSLVLQIQHPEALIIPKKLERQSSSGSLQVLQETNRRVQQPQTPSTSPREAFTKNLSSNHENIPLHRVTHTQYQPLPQATIFVCGNSALEFVNCFVGDRINSFVQLNSCAFCFGVSLKLCPSSPPFLNSIVAIDNWESFSYLFHENKGRTQENHSSHQLSCINIRLVVVEDDNFFLNCCPWMFSTNSLFILTFDTSRLLSSSEVEMSRLSRIACAVRTGMKNHRGINEGASFLPQAFSPAMSAPSSVSSGNSSLMMVGIETSQASNLEEIRVLFYTSLGEALPRPDIIPVKQGDMSPDMVKLRWHIFQVLNRCVTNAHGPPHVTSTSNLVSHGTRNANSTPSFANGALECDVLLQSSQTRISFQTAVALDIIAGHQLLTISQKKLLKILQESSLSSFFEESSTAAGAINSTGLCLVNGRGHSSHHQEAGFTQVVEDLHKTRNIFLLDSLNVSCRLEEDKEFILPAVLFDQLLQLAQRAGAGGLSEIQQNILRTLSNCGIISRQELSEFLSLVSSYPEKLILCLDDLRVIFPVRAGQHLQLQEADSGFDDGPSFLFPYFKEDLPFDPNLLDSFEEHWTIQFSEEVAITNFYCILSELSQRWPPGLILSLQSQLVAQVTQVGLPGLADPHHSGGVVLYYICFQQIMSQIQAFKRRIGSHRPIPKSKENQMTENLTVTSVMAVATKHISASNRLYQLQRNEPQSVSSTSVTSPVQAVIPPPTTNLRRRYSGDFQVALPFEPNEDEENEPEGAAAFLPPTEENRAHVQMMGKRINQLSYIMPELYEIYMFLSANDDWTELAAHLGLTHLQINLYRSLLPTRPGTLSGQTFLETYMNEDDVTVRALLQALLKMSKKIYHKMAQKLWTAALLNNSSFYLDLRRNRKI